MLYKLFFNKQLLKEISDYKFIFLEKINYSDSLQYIFCIKWNLFTLK